jgi:hypothetical protein
MEGQTDRHGGSMANVWSAVGSRLRTSRREQQVCRVQGARQNKLWAQGVAGLCLHARFSRNKRGPSTRSTAKIDPAPVVQGSASGPELCLCSFGGLAHSSSGTPLGPWSRSRHALDVAACVCRRATRCVMGNGLMEWVNR